MKDEIDETIERIEADLQENEQPLPKAAPTQQGINNRPREMPDESEMRELSVVLHTRDGREIELPRVGRGVTGAMRRFAESSESASARLQELQALASLPGVDISAVFENQRLAFTYQVKCRDCNFRFPKQVIELEFPDTHIPDRQIAEQHVNRYQHTVDFHLEGRYSPSANFCIEPEKRTWRERLNRWAVCIIFPILFYVGVITILGKFSWWNVAGACIGALIGFNLYEYWQNRKGGSNQE